MRRESSNRAITFAPVGANQYRSRLMHYIAPIPIIFGVIGAIVGLLWLVAAGSDEDGGPETGLFIVFGTWYIAMRVLKQLSNEPMSVLPAFGILLLSAGLIWLGVVML
jgi:hypothetical protein